jgi:Na+-driven multidrug efflux pump
MNIINIFLSYILIYGVDIQNVNFHIYVLGMGIIGAALGIAIARTTEL